MNKEYLMSIIKGHSIVDAIYFVVISLTTVGKSFIHIMTIKLCIVIKIG